MSSATDELRRLLDGRGIEHMDFNMPDKFLTMFGGGEHDGAYTENSVDTILTLCGASPEQAVEATLGRGEVERLQDENERLRSCLSDSAENSKQIMHEAHVQEEENARLRELVLHMHTCLEHYEPGDTISCKQCPYDNETWGCDYERLIAELGIEVEV